MKVTPIAERIEERVHRWNVVIHNTLETESSWVGLGTRGAQPVVLKVIRRPGDEWRSGEVLDAFAGRGSVRVYEWVQGALLLERLMPATPLVDLTLNGRDDEATEILCEVIQQMAQPRTASMASFPTTEEWAGGFQRYLASSDSKIRRDLVEHGQHLYLTLSASQQNTGLLHADLHHYNVLFDSVRGWLAIDPKGLVAEVEYELGAALRNPYERPEFFASSSAVECRLKRYSDMLKVDASRVLKWGFAQAVLSAIWSVEDGFTVDDETPAILLANTIRPMLM